MSTLDRLTSRALALFGLDFDLDLSERPFHPVAPGLLVGQRPRPDGVQALQEAGVTHVVSCLEESEREGMAFLGERFRTRFLPLRDSVHQRLAPVLPTFLEEVHHAQAAGGQLLVHCRVGVSRSAALAIAAVMTERRLDFYDAFQQVRARRPQVLPNIAFASELHRYGQGLDVASADGLARYLVEVCRAPVEREVLQDALEAHAHDALPAIRAVFGGDIPRVVQGVRT